MSKWHIIWLLLLGYVLGYYFRSPGNMTIAKLYNPGS